MLKLPDLPYSKDALAPYMGAETLELHHGKHHAGYVEKANDMLEGSDLADKPLEEIVKAAHGSDQGLFNNVGQHFNHVHFWQAMRPDGGGAIPSELESRIVDGFGSVDEFKSAFKEAGTGQFGSGWCWLYMKDGKLDVMGTPNAESPLVHDAVPLLGCDVWEHSYYLDHRNDRGAYLDTFLDKLVNWEFVAEQLGANS